MPFSDEASRWGLRRALTRVALAKAERWSRSRIFLVQTCDNRPVAAEQRIPVPPTVTLRCLDFDSAMSLCRHAAYRLRPALIEFVHLHDHEIWGVYEGDRLVHYAVRGARVAPAENGLVLRLGSSHVYYYKSFTLPEFRGRGYAQLRSQMTRDLLQGTRGEWSIFYVAPYNYASLRANEKLPALDVGYAGYIRVGSRFRFLASKPVRRTGFCFDLPATAEERSVVADS